MVLSIVVHGRKFQNLGGALRYVVCSRARNARVPWRRRVLTVLSICNTLITIVLNVRIQLTLKTTLRVISVVQLVEVLSKVPERRGFDSRRDH